MQALGGIARRGLEGFGVDPEEADRAITTIERRAVAGQTGAAWQRARLARLGDGAPTPKALGRMLEDYMERSASGEPVHEWSVA